MEVVKALVITLHVISLHGNLFTMSLRVSFVPVGSTPTQPATASATRVGAIGMAAQLVELVE